MRRPNSHIAGFTLVELIVVLTIVSITSAYAFMRSGSAGTLTLNSQAQTLAQDIRHTQALATTWGTSLRLSTTGGANGSYRVACVNTSSSSPCNLSPVTNPGTGSSYAVTLARNVVLAGSATLDIDSFGTPLAAASFTLSAGGATKTVAVAPVTGFVTVTP